MRAAARVQGAALAVGVVAALLLWFLVPFGVAAADPDGHGQGPPTTTVTEDNDDDGVANNIPDDGDDMHPSGKDRSVEPGRSGDQGRSRADPDGDGNGGPDKPGGAGGVDVIDQDRNNGCGNDDDFEDDNNGNCRGRQTTTTVTVRELTFSTTSSTTTTPTSVVPTVGALVTPPPASVLGVQIERPAAQVAPAPQAQVLGESLARTGSPIRAYVVLASAVLLLGLALRATSWRRGIRMEG
jgi:hypothetical protein